MCLLTPQWSVGCPLSSSCVDSTHRACRGVWSFCKSIANGWYGEVYRSVILSSQIRLGSFLRVPVGSVGWSRNVWRYIISSSIFFKFNTKPFKSDIAQPLPQRCPGVGYARPTKPCCWKGKRLHRGGDIFCELCVSLAKSLLSMSFLFPPEWT